MSSYYDRRTSRTLGALLVVHCGDSLGATLEFKPWSRIIREYPGDDTDLTRAVLLAYRDYEERKAAGNGPSVEEFDITRAAAEYALKWNEGDWPGRKKGSRPVDVGNSTRDGLRKYKISRDPSKSGAGIGSAGNGSSMRCIPTGLFAFEERRQRESIAISAFTHNDPRYTVACAAYNETVAALVKGQTAQEAVEIGKMVAENLNCPKVTIAIQQGQTLDLVKIASQGPRGETKVDPSGFVLNGLKLSIAAVLDVRSFEDVLVDIVSIGGDADTNGAIAGGLLGARDGVEALPERWLNKLQFRDEFAQVGLRILQLQASTV